MGVWKHLQAIIVLPVMGTIVVPGTILYLAGIDGLAFSLVLPWNIAVTKGMCPGGFRKQKAVGETNRRLGGRCSAFGEFCQ